jgi:two-component system, NarL family, invasion response regulator UvrY
MIDLLVVDDHAIFRAGLRRLLSDETDMRVVAEASTGQEAMELIRERRFDIVVLDINMKGRSGLDTLAALRIEFPRLPVLMLSMYIEPQYTQMALRANANAYLSKDTDPEELTKAIRRVAAGGYYMPQGGVAHLGLDEERPAHESLSQRERHIMMKIVSGHSLTAIGVQLSLSVKTVSTYRSRVMEKLCLTSNAELVQYAMRNGLID